MASSRGRGLSSSSRVAAKAVASSSSDRWHLETLIIFQVTEVDLAHHQIVAQEILKVIWAVQRRVAGIIHLLVPRRLGSDLKVEDPHSSRGDMGE